MLRNLTAVALGFGLVAAHATPPQNFTTHNQTTVQSNAYIAGIASPFPTNGGTTRQVLWNMIRLACFGHTDGDNCSAVVKMATDTPKPIEVGTLTMNLKTGDIQQSTFC